MRKRLTYTIFSKEFCNAFRNTWQAIAPDAMDAVGVDEGSYDARDMAETVIDADRLKMYGGNLTHRLAMDGHTPSMELDRLIDKHGYKAVLDAASELI